MRVLVCGSRDWTDYEAVKREIMRLPATLNLVIHGCAVGADHIAGLVAFRSGIKVASYPADWGKYGKWAGFVRNQQMIDEGKPDLVLAFWKNKGRGTEDMIRKARKARIEVKVIEG